MNKTEKDYIDDALRNMTDEQKRTYLREKQRDKEHWHALLGAAIFGIIIGFVIGTLYTDYSERKFAEDVIDNCSRAYLYIQEFKDCVAEITY